MTPPIQRGNGRIAARIYSAEMRAWALRPVRSSNALVSETTRGVIVRPRASRDGDGINTVKKSIPRWL